MHIHKPTRPQLIFSSVFILILVISTLIVGVTLKPALASGFTSLDAKLSPTSAILHPGELATFTYTVTNGTYPFTVIWSLNGSVVQTDFYSKQILFGSGNSTLPIQSTYTYKCEGATEDVYSLSVVVQAGHGAQHSESALIYDPFNSPVKVLTSTTDASYSYKIEADGLGWYRAVNGTDSSVSWTSTNASYIFNTVFDQNPAVVETGDGTFNVANTLTLPPGITWRGQGADSSYSEVVTDPQTKLNWTGGAAEFIVTDTSNAWFGKIENMLVDGNDVASIGLTITAGKGYSVTDVILRNFASQGLLVNTINGINSTNTDGVFTRTVSVDSPVAAELNGFGAGKEVTLLTFIEPRFAGTTSSFRFYQYADTIKTIGGRIEATQFGIILGEAINNGVDQNSFFGTAVDSQNASSTGILARQCATPHDLFGVSFGGTFGTKVNGVAYIEAHGTYSFATTTEFTTAEFAINATGVLEIVTPHNLTYTPDPNQIDIQLLQVTDVVDYVLFTSVKYVDATNVSILIIRVTASATAGATAKASVKVLPPQD